MNEEAKIRALFERRRHDPFEPRLSGISGAYRFDIEGIGSFHVAIDDGRVSVSEGERAADCIIRCAPEDFLHIADGSQNLLTAAMQGLVEVSGDLALAQKLHGILPGPAPQPEAQP
jgi:putative sterol carrier protein